MLYVIIADGSFDQVCETRAQAVRERNDLKRMGCAVTIKTVEGWGAANALEDKMR